MMEKRNFHQKLVAIIDKNLTGNNNQPMTLSSLWMKIQFEVMSLSHAAEGSCSLDRDYSTTVKFIRSHPHLYKFENEFVHMRSEIHRRCVSKMLVNLMKCKSQTVDVIGMQLGAVSESNDFKNSTYGKGMESMRNFMSDHKYLFSKIEPFPDSRAFMNQAVKICHTDIYYFGEEMEANSITVTNQEFSVDQKSDNSNTGTSVHRSICDDDFSCLAEIIDQNLAEKLQFSKLWEQIKQKITSNYSKSYMAEDVKWFIQHHPHLYEFKNGFVSKRTQEHRMILSELIDYLKTQKSIYTKKEIFGRLRQIAFDFQPNIDASGESALETFFNDHEHLFERFSSNNEDAEKRKPTNTCLRFQYVHTIKERLQTIDNNTTITAYGTVNSVRSTNNLLLYIGSGEYAGQYVYCKMTELLSPCLPDIPLQVGDKVKLKAVKRMHKAYPWQATFIAPYSTDIATHKNNTTVEDPADEPNFNCTPVQKNGMEKSNEQPKAHYNANTFADDRSLLPRRCILLAFEETRFRLVDSFLRDSGQTADQLFQKFDELSIVLTPNLFHTENQLHEFIDNRPHLFHVDMNLLITNTSDKFRSAMFDLLHICQEDQSVEALRLVISAKTSAAYEVLIEYAATETEFINFLRNYEKIFELSELLPNKGRILRSRGYCDAKKRLFLPRFYFKHEH